MAKKKATKQPVVQDVESVADVNTDIVTVSTVTEPSSPSTAVNVQDHLESSIMTVVEGSVENAKASQEKGRAIALAQQREKLRFTPHIRKSDGRSIPLTAAQFGNFVLERYNSCSFYWTEDFAAYRDSHAMGPILERLKSGMDEVSCDYVDRTERLHDISRVSNFCFVSDDLLWSPSDKMLLKRNFQQVAAGTPPFLQQVNLDWSSSYTNWYGLYDMPSNVLKAVNGKAVFDVGGYIGDTLPVLRALFPKSQLLSFEPNEQNFKKLVTLMPDEIAAGSIVAFQQGIADKQGKMFLLQHSEGVEAISTMMKGAKGLRQTEVMVNTIDAVVKERNLEVGLIKVDIEGLEPQVIQGALETIKQQKPVLVLATYHQPEEYYELKPYLDSLNLGYKFRLRRSCFCFPLSDVVLIAYVDDAE